MLDIINQQGAQVVALQNQVNALQSILILLADGATTLRFERDQIEAINERVAGVTWNVSKSGRVVVTVKRPK